MADFSVNLNLVLPANGEFPNIWDGPVNQNFRALDALFGINGHTHSGAAGQGPAISHTSLTNIGTNPHTAIDAHIANNLIHQDTQIQTITTEPATATFNNINEIRFENCEVTTLGAGAVLVSPNIAAPSVAVAQTAPQVATDNFQAAMGASLDKRCWRVVTAATGAPKYTIGSALSTSVGAEMSFTSAQSASGFNLNLYSPLIPHSWNQRVTVSVDKYRPVGLVPNASDSWSLWLHVLASDRTTGNFNSPSRPIESGLSARLEIRKPASSSDHLLNVVFMVMNQGQVVTYNTPITSPTNWTNPNAGSTVWANLPMSYILGTHEFAISQDKDNELNFILHYYYGAGLIFTKTFTSADGQFYTAVRNLINSYQSLTSPSVPDYGRIGFSTAYSLNPSTGMQYDFKIACFSATSVRDLESPRAVYYPNTPPWTSGGSNTNAGGEPYEPTTPTVPVCGGAAPWTGLQIGSNFDPDGAGPESAANWVITQVIPSTLLNSASFNVTNSLTGQTIRVYCNPPNTNPGPPPSLPPFILPLSPNPVDLPTGSGPVGDFSDAVLVVETPNTIPTAWASGNPTTDYFPPGTTLPITFGRVTDVVSAPSGGLASLEATLQGGLRIPPGVNITVRVTPQYLDTVANPTYVATYTNLIKTKYGVPVPLSTKVFQYDPFRFSATDGWGTVSETEKVLEGTTVLALYSGANTPLGPGFWAPGASFDNYGIQNTIGPVGFALGLLTSQPSVAPTPLWSRIVAGSIPSSVSISGVPPTAVIPAASTDPGVSIPVGPGVHEYVAAIFRLHPRAWNSGNAASAELRMRDNVLNSSFPNIPWVTPEMVEPRPPTIRTTPTISSTAAGVKPTIVVTVQNADPDLFLTPTSGFVGPPAPIGPGDTGVIITGDDEEKVWTITPTVSGTGWELGPAGAQIIISATNQAANLAFPGLHTVDSLIGTVDGGPILLSPPAATYVSGTLIEDRITPLVLQLDTATLSPTTTFSFPSGGSEFFSVSNIVPIQKAPVAGTLENWRIPVQTVDIPGGGTLPATATIRVTNAANSLFTDVAGIPVQAATSPVLLSTVLDFFSSGSNIWNIEDQATRDLCMTINNTRPGDLSIRVARRRSAVVTILTQVTPPIQDPGAINFYRVTVTLPDAPLVGDELLIVASNATAGEPLSSTMDPAIVFAGGISIGNAGDAVFVTRPIEGHYFTFQVEGVLPSGPPTVEFQTPGGVSLHHPSNPTSLITASTTSSIQGSARLAPNTAGTEIRVRVIVGALSTSALTSVLVSAPPAPLITSADFTSLTEGQTGVTITLGGSFLVPPPPPAGQPALSYVYTFTDTLPLLDVLSNVSQVSVTNTQLQYTADINPSTFGFSVGMDIDYLGGDIVSFTELGVIQDAPVGDPTVTAVASSNDFGNPLGTNRATAGVGQSLFIRITGTGLGANNVNPSTANAQFGVVLTATGTENLAAAANVLESPAGAGISQLFGSRVIPTTLVSQSDTEIVCRAAVFNPTFGDIRFRAHLVRPASHPMGAGQWDPDFIDLTGAPDTYGVKHFGMTTSVAAFPGTLKVNSNINAGTTRLATARFLQAAAAANVVGGGSFAIPVRFNQALASPPAIKADIDPIFGTQLENLTITQVGTSGFDFEINGNFPVPGVNNTFPSPIWDVSDPTWAAISMVNGNIPIASAVLGVNFWDTPLGDYTDDVQA